MNLILCHNKKEVKKLERLKLEGERFGRLVVLKIASKEEKPKDKNGKPRQRSFWICQCDCGTIKEIGSSHLLQGHTLSCGCIKSYGEKEIQKILEDLNISYITQKSFSDLKSKIVVNSFSIEVLYKNKKILIEYQGEQHYKKVNFFGGEEGFLQRKEHDDLKRQYCKRNNIPLIEYSYNEKISQEKLLNKLEECI